jgi:hypothetical protein
MFKLNDIQNFINNSLLEKYSDNDEVDYNEINLQGEYDKLNKLLFDDDLPKVKMKWDKGKRAAGHVRHSKNRATGETRILHLSMSVFFRTTYREFLDTLAHEMIHVHNIHNDLQSKMYDPHGEYFLKEMNRINSMGIRFNINTTKDSHALGRKVSGHVRMKKPLVALLFNVKNKKGIIVMSQATWQDESQGGPVLLRMFKRWVSSGKEKEVKYIVVKSWDAQLKVHKVQRSFARKVSWAYIDEEDWTDLAQGDILKQDTINSDSIPDEEKKQQAEKTTNFAFMKKEKRRLRRLLKNGQITSEQWKEQMKAAGWQFK